MLPLDRHQLTSVAPGAIIKITISDATPEFEEKLLALLAPYADTITLEANAAWGADRARRYYCALPPRAQKILEEAIGRGGHVSADALRGDDGTGSLKGHSAGLKRILDKGAREGWWPDTIPSPVQAQGPGFGKVVGYTVPEAHLDVFRDTVLSLPTGRRAVLSDQITQRGSTVRWDATLASEVLGSHGLDTDHKGARAILRHLADAGLIVRVDPNRAIYRLATES